MDRFQESENKIPCKIEKGITIKKVHKEIQHRGINATYFEIKENKKHYWPGLKIQIKEQLGKCITYLKQNIKYRLKNTFVETKAPGELIGIDIMKLEDKNIILRIDYFSKKVWKSILIDRKYSSIIDFTTKKFRNLKIDEIVSDNAKEFVSQKFKQFLTKEKIRHHLTSLETQQSNGKFEKLIRNIRNTFRKYAKTYMKEKL